ncbi:MAG: hypothetical protein GX561_03010 [Lentisphaerae bacterium]|jgi:hypothetical protein|nr:hypothetical protein [Lentisphaerota bacterium]
MLEQFRRQFRETKKMKRVLPVLLMLTALAASGADNLLKNPGFEEKGALQRILGVHFLLNVMASTFIHPN